MKKGLSALILASAIGAGGMFYQNRANSNLLSENPKMNMIGMDSLDIPLLDPHNLRRFLRTNEFVLPKDAVNFWDPARAEHFKDYDHTTIDGFYVRPSKSDYDKSIEKGRRYLESRFGKDIGEFFYGYMTKNHSIILNGKILQDEERFRRVLFHERIHEYLSEDLSKGERQLLGEVSHKILHKLGTGSPFVPKDSYDPKLGGYVLSKKQWDNIGGESRFAEAYNSWEEFYAYLASGEMGSPEVQKWIMAQLQENEQSSDIFNRIKKKSEL